MWCAKALRVSCRNKKPIIKSRISGYIFHNSGPKSCIVACTEHSTLSLHDALPIFSLMKIFGKYIDNIWVSEVTPTLHSASWFLILFCREPDWLTYGNGDNFRAIEHLFTVIWYGLSYDIIWLIFLSWDIDE